jgi:hypothetical protein
MSDERAEIRFKRAALLEVRALINQMLESLEKAEAALDESEKADVLEFKLPDELDETKKPLGWLRMQIEAAERSGWISDVVFDKSALRFRLKQGDKRGQLEKWVKWVWGVAEKKGVKKGG